ncbi:N-6 DNA methylase [Salmonella enterica subsp. enterica serovar Infantis]|nr:N-6 DNA methylase [Salmonella enterica subsp. enterica serovar Infantis]EJX3136568.1 N-6 DNA methylase [Salmonella enterica subsp. enterica serovar Schwarzengrund]EJZ4703894.1 N-6 DNA methylase [Salmonella enterica]EJR3263939.1 N-6 DNA methylase [Salmonella enterica subsp. enterica serovar Infantis]EJZ3726082.1 N-6 DNA methylase [Salmonella enterica subsp. enterica serovar Infantis]
MNNIQKLSKLITEIKNPSSPSNATNLIKGIELFTGFCLYLVLDGLTKKDSSFKITSEIFDGNIIKNMSKNEVVKYTKAADAAFLYMDIIKQEEAFTDVLSELFEDLYLTGKNGDGLGQFLTPNDISNLTSSLQASSRHSGTFYEECCGAGSMTLARLRERCRREGHYLDQAIQMNDIDPLMVKMAIVQIMAPVAFKDVDIKSVKIFNGNAILNNLKSSFSYTSYHNKNK